MNDYIETGDKVRHVSSHINAGLPMTVQEIDNNRLNAKCSHMVGPEAAHKEDWFLLTDLVLNTKGNNEII